MATLVMMLLLTLVGIGLLTLSGVSLRSASQERAKAEARANARMALILAMGELQKEMGPDMRISAESALLDNNKSTDAVDGVSQSHWLASYNSWGDWLNGSYSLPGVGGKMKIGETYTLGREKMFRRWLLSLPNGMERTMRAPIVQDGWDDSNSVVLVGAGTLGSNALKQKDLVTRAYLTPVGKTGKSAWWIGPENQKAKISLAGKSRSLAASDWELSQGDVAEMGVGLLSGFEALDSKTAPVDRMITTNSLRHVKVEQDKAQSSFFDLTAASQGVVVSVRGTAKKDLSLLFEKDPSKLPSPYKFTAIADVREPSIRPMSPDLQDKKAVRPNRYFASWTNMRHYYRMYRSTSDATIGGAGGTGNLGWTQSTPFTTCVTTTAAGSSSPDWDGSNNYWRMPILAKVTFIYSLLAEPNASPGKYDCYQVYSPVFTFWNPYNTQLRVPDGIISMLTSAYKIMPNAGQFWLGESVNKGTNSLGLSINTQATLRSGTGSDIVFKPGEIRVFSFASRNTSSVAVDLVPGFDPQAIGGEKLKWGTYTPAQNPGLAVEFSHSYWGGNVNVGNTGGAFAFVWWYNRGSSAGSLPMTYSNDWFQRNPHNPDQTHTPMTPPGISNVARWVFDGKPLPVAFGQLVIKGLSELNYESINWEKDWRCRNWIQAPPFYFGSGLYMSMDDTTAQTQRLDCPYVLYFGPTSMSEMAKVVGYDPSSNRAFLGSGSNPYEQVTSASMLELPSAPISSLAGFSNMRINPGWTRIKDGDPQSLYPDLFQKGYAGDGITSPKASLYADEVKAVTYQSGVTGPGIGNSFMHPMLPRSDVYKFIDNSKSQDTPDRNNWTVTETADSKSYNDYWDHVFLLNDALWDDYFVSSLADQKRPSAGTARNLSQNLDQLVAGKDLANVRYRFYNGGKASSAVKTDLQSDDGYLKAAKYLMVDGMFNVNSTSVAAWQALFTGIRERQLVYRDSSGSLRAVTVPTGKRIALSRFDTEISDQEMADPGAGAKMPDGSQGWTGVRYLDDDQLLNLAKECVKQVKQRGPFLNFSEFINRRLSNDKLGIMGALQSAIDYDDDSPDPKSINYKYKKNPAFMIKGSDLGANSFATPDAVNGSRFAGIPGYVIQSDLLKPIANTLSVRDDTFRIRAYGESFDANGKVAARAWCEAIVQRMPEYCESSNEADVPARLLDANGLFTDNGKLSSGNRFLGRKFKMVDFRWLSANEI